MTRKRRLNFSLAKNVPTTATDILKTNDESTFLGAKEVQSDSEDVEERAEKTRRKVARKLTEFRSD